MGRAYLAIAKMYSIVPKIVVLTILVKGYLLALASKEAMMHPELTVP